VNPTIHTSSPDLHLCYNARSRPRVSIRSAWFGSSRILIPLSSASGFIGFPAAQALSRAGHQVFGVTRSESKAKLLAADESEDLRRPLRRRILTILAVIPIVGEPKDSQIWTDLVPTLDVVIDAVGGAEIGTLGEALFNAARSAAESARTAGAPRLTYIYTSGTWVHGDNRHGDAQVSDTSALATPTPLTAWRIPHEQRVTRDTVLNGIVIRPSLLYGKSGSILAALFAGAAQGKVSWPGRPGGRWAVIHTDDLADV
jgi:nucleoside-diphosphate-sugar epimerase